MTDKCFRCTTSMAGDGEKWYYTKEELMNTPSRKMGIDADKELSYRQQAANLIQDMGQRLQVSQLCINTAIVYMHRFFMLHSFASFHRNHMSLAALFLAAKVEEQPRKLEHLIKISQLCLHRDGQELNVSQESYIEQAQDIIMNENLLLQTLGFDVAIDHPHTHVVRCCQLVRACKDLAQTSYFMASNSLHLTMMCLQYKPTVVACFCIHLACKWACWEIPVSNEGKPWYFYVDHTVTFDLLDSITKEFLHVFDKCPSRLRKRILSMKKSEPPSMPLASAPFDADPRRLQQIDAAIASTSSQGVGSLLSSSTVAKRKTYTENEERQRTSAALMPPPPSRNTNDIYREKRERERAERERLAANFNSHHTFEASTSSTTSSSSHSHTSHPTSQPLQKPGMPGLNKHQSANQKSAIHHHSHPKSEMLKPGQAAPPRQHGSNNTSGSSMGSRDGSQRQKPRDYHTPAVQSQTHSLPSLESSTVPPHSNSVENNKHQVHDKRGSHEYRFKPQQPSLEHHRKEADNKISHGKRKPEDVRIEEVRKLMEKPVPIKPREEQQKEDYMSHMLKQSHKPNYGQELKPPVASQHSVHGVAKILKETIKNGNSSSGGASSFSLNSSSFEDSYNTGSQDEGALNMTPQQPIIRKRSLFSPDDTSAKNESATQQRINKYKQKTSPMESKLPKRENAAPEMPLLENKSLFGTNVTHQQHPVDKQLERVSRRLDMNPSSDSFLAKSAVENCVKVEKPSLKTEDLSAVMNGVPVKNNSIESSKSSMPELDRLTNDQANSMELFSVDMPAVKMEIEIPKKEETPSPLKAAKSINALLQECIQTPSLINRSLIPSVTAPTAVAVNMSVSEEVATTTGDQRPFSANLASSQMVPPTMSSNITPMLSTALPALSVDASSITEPPSATIVGSAQTALNLPLSQQSETKKEHRKSEKKKKKEKKSKHKESEKPKDKHKHKRKDKDKESRKNKDKEREKDRSNKDREKEKSARSEDAPAAPIKITIPKDRLNMTTEQEKTNPGLKIKIPKERIKAPETTTSSAKIESATVGGRTISPTPPAIPAAQMQAPLKIKIRTSASSSEITPAHDSHVSSRKRERLDDSPGGLTAAKRPAISQATSGTGSYAATQTVTATQRPSERQNGRHYNASSNNKVRGCSTARAGSYSTQHPRQSNFASYRREPNYRPQNPASTSYFYAGYPPPSHTMYQQQMPSYMYDPNYVGNLHYYQPYAQSCMYPGGNVIMTAAGTIDTSVPPPSLATGTRNAGANSSAENRPPLPQDVPPQSYTPPPPPLPDGPPPSAPPPPPPPADIT